MSTSDYNKYLAAIKIANDYDESRAKAMLRQIEADMVTSYGLNDDDVNYLLSQFRYYTT